MPLEPLTAIDSQAHLIENANVDTDVIYPARFLLVLDREGIGQYAFRDWRTARNGTANPKFPAPQLADGERQILVAGANFGCGSSREHAVWTLADLGLRCVIAPSFGEIFYSNCFKNGVLPVEIADLELWGRIRDAARAGDNIRVDLTTCEVTVSGHEPVSFTVPAYRRDALLNGWDEIDMVLEQDGDDIRAFETERQAALPWLFQSLDR